MKTETIQPDRLYWASGNYVQFRIPGQAILDICHSGPNDDAVNGWAAKISRYEFGEAHAAPTPDRIRHQMEEYGAWDSEELEDDSANWERLVWSFAWSIREEDEPDCSDPVAD